MVRAIRLLAGLCLLLLIAGPAAAQFVPAPSGTPMPHGAMAIVIDPNTQVAVEFSTLDAEPGTYEKLMASPDHMPTADQVYTDLRKSGATVALSLTINTTSGIKGSLSMKTPISYQAMVDGQTKTLSIDVGTTADVSPEVLPGGSAALSIGYTRIDPANDTKQGDPPATNTVSFTAWRELHPGESALLGVINPTAGFGTQKDEVVFVRVLSIKHM